MDLTLPIIVFLVLLLTHIGVLLLGYKLGAQVNPEIYMSKSKRKEKPGPPVPDQYLTERLDLDYE